MGSEQSLVFNELPGGAERQHDAVDAIAASSRLRERFKLDVITRSCAEAKSFDLHATLIGADGRESTEEKVLQASNNTQAFSPEHGRPVDGANRPLDRFMFDLPLGDVRLPLRSIKLRMITRSDVAAWSPAFVSITYLGDAAWWKGGGSGATMQRQHHSPVELGRPPQQWDALPQQERQSCTRRSSTIVLTFIEGLESSGPSAKWTSSRDAATLKVCGAVGSDVATLRALRELMPRMRTGDVLLYNSESWTSKPTRYFSGLPFSHAGLLVVARARSEEQPAQRGEWRAPRRLARTKTHSSHTAAGMMLSSVREEEMVEGEGDGESTTEEDEDADDLVYALDDERIASGSFVDYATRSSSEASSSAPGGATAASTSTTTLGTVLLAYEATPNHSSNRDFLLEAPSRHIQRSRTSSAGGSAAPAGRYRAALPLSTPLYHRAHFKGVYGFDFIERVLCYNGDVLWAPLTRAMRHLSTTRNNAAVAKRIADYARRHHLGMTKYDLAQFFTAGLERISMHMIDVNGDDDDTEVFCSEFVVEALKAGFGVSNSKMMHLKFSRAEAEPELSAPLHQHGRFIFTTALTSAPAEGTEEEEKTKSLMEEIRANLAELSASRPARMPPGELYELGMVGKVTCLRATTDVMRAWVRRDEHVDQQPSMSPGGAAQKPRTPQRRISHKWGSYHFVEESVSTIQESSLDFDDAVTVR